MDILIQIETAEFIDKFRSHNIPYLLNTPEHKQQYDKEFKALKSLTEVGKITTLSIQAKDIKNELVRRMRETYYPNHAEHGIR